MKEETKFGFGVVGWIIIITIVLVVLGLGVRYASLHIEGYFQPKEQNVKRKVFKETRSFNEAKVQELVKYRLEYLKEDDLKAKEAIASTIRISFADYDPNKLDNGELRTFLRAMINGGKYE